MIDVIIPNMATSTGLEARTPEITSTEGSEPYVDPATDPTIAGLADALFEQARFDPATRLLTYTAMGDAITEWVGMENPTLQANAALFYVRIGGLGELSVPDSATLLRDLAKALHEIVTTPEAEEQVGKISGQRLSQAGRTDNRNELGLFFPDLRRVNTHATDTTEDSQKRMSIYEHFEEVQQLVRERLQTVLDEQPEQISKHGIGIVIGGSTFRHGMNAKDLMRAADAGLKQKLHEREIERYDAIALPRRKRLMRWIGNWALRRAGTGAHPDLESRS